MMIAYPMADICCSLSEEKILTLVFENQHLFYDIVSDISMQLEGERGNFVLSEDYQPLDLRKHIELVTQFVPFSINQKELINKLYSDLKNKATDAQLYQQTSELYGEISRYLYVLTEEYGSELTFDTPDDISGLLKSFNVRFYDDDKSLAEKVLEYAIAVNELKGDRILVFVNMRSYLTDTQMESLFKNFILRKISVICIENKEYSKLQNEERIIVDEDMCLI